MAEVSFPRGRRVLLKESKCLLQGAEVSSRGAEVSFSKETEVSDRAEVVGADVEGVEVS